MKEFTAIEYLAIDIANHFGLDKQTFENRIQWVRDHQDVLEQQTAEEPYLYQKAVMAFRKALKGLPIGHMVGLDSVASGMQLMSVMTGCISGCTLTGLVDPDKRMDAYTEITKAMQGTVAVSRAQAKEAVMTYLYGSEAVPKRVFDVRELRVFHRVMAEKAKGADWLLGILLEAWDKDALHHSWVLPDGYEAYVPVMVKKSTRVNITELNYTMSMEYYNNEPTKFSKSLPANAIHSVDAYVLRSMVRHCNYDKTRFNKLVSAIEIELMDRAVHDTDGLPEQDPKVSKYLNLWRSTGMVDLVVVEHFKERHLKELPSSYLKKLKRKLLTVLEYPSFELVTVHDQFACHPNHCNRMRWWYKEILAELSESRTLVFILSALFKEEVSLTPLAPVGHLIRNSNYGLC